MTQPQPLAHDLAPQIDIAIAQAHFLINGLVQLERQRIGAVQQLEFRRHDLDPSRGQVGVDRARRTLAHKSAYAHDELMPQFLGDFKYRLVVGMEHDLYRPPRSPRSTKITPP